MLPVFARTFLWIGRVLFVTVALWWPAIWRDPIYTPRQARMVGYELHLADGTVPQTDDERALAIFWAWEHRQFVETRWMVGPFLGIRSANRTGWQQTIFAMVFIWVFFGFLLGRRNEDVTPLGESPGAPSKRKFSELVTTPLWQLFQRSR